MVVNVGEILTSYDGYKFYVESEQHKDPLRRDEQSVLSTLVMLGKRDRTFVDVGAGYGRYTVRMAEFYALVYAIEPLPEHLRILRKNIEINNLDNVIILPFLAYDRKGEIPIYLNGLSSSCIKRPDMTDYITVKADRLDNLIKNADVIKIDVEGAEFIVLKGAERLLKKDKPVLIIEHHDFRPDWKDTVGGTYQKIFEYMTSLGYVPLYLTYVHRCWIHKEKLSLEQNEGLYYVLWKHWFNMCCLNLKQGREWYYGLPKTWWWGYDFSEFIEELPIHILVEPEWSDPQQILRIQKELKVV